MRVRIIYICHGQGVITVHKLFSIITNVFISSGTNFIQKTVKFINSAKSPTTLVHSCFVQTLKKYWCKRNLKILYVLHTSLVRMRFSKLFFSFHCHSFFHFTSTKEEVTLIKLKKKGTTHQIFTSKIYNKKIEI